MTGHTKGLTPAEFTAMVEGQRYHKNGILELVQFGVYHVLSPYMDKGTTFYEYWDKPKPEPEPEDAEALKAEREAAARLWRKINTGAIARQEVVGSFAGRGK